MNIPNGFCYLLLVPKEYRSDAIVTLKAYPTLDALYEFACLNDFDKVIYRASEISKSSTIHITPSKTHIISIQHLYIIYPSDYKVGGRYHITYTTVFQPSNYIYWLLLFMILYISTAIYPLIHEYIRFQLQVYTCSVKESVTFIDSLFDQLENLLSKGGDASQLHIDKDNVSTVHKCYKPFEVDLTAYARILRFTIILIQAFRLVCDYNDFFLVLLLLTYPVFQLQLLYVRRMIRRQTITRSYFESIARRMLRLRDTRPNYYNSDDFCRDTYENRYNIKPYTSDNLTFPIERVAEVRVTHEYYIRHLNPQPWDINYRNRNLTFRDVRNLDNTTINSDILATIEQFVNKEEYYNLYRAKHTVQDIVLTKTPVVRDATITVKASAEDVSFMNRHNISFEKHVVQQSTTGSPHLVNTVNRDIQRKIIIERIPQSKKVLVVGGNPAAYPVDGYYHICPEVDSNDSVRNSNRFSYYEEQRKKGIYIEASTHRIETLKGMFQIAIVVHSSYDIPIHTLFLNLVMLGVSKIFLVSVVNAALITDDSGCLPLQDMNFKKYFDVKTQRVRIAMQPNGETSSAYDHDWINYYEYLEARCIRLTNSLAYIGKVTFDGYDSNIVEFALGLYSDSWRNKTIFYQNKHCGDITRLALIKDVKTKWLLHRQRVAVVDVGVATVNNIKASASAQADVSHHKMEGNVMLMEKSWSEPTYHPYLADYFRKVNSCHEIVVACNTIAVYEKIRNSALARAKLNTSIVAYTIYSIKNLFMGTSFADMLEDLLLQQTILPYPQETEIPTRVVDVRNQIARITILRESALKTRKEDLLNLLESHKQSYTFLSKNQRYSEEVKLRKETKKRTRRFVKICKYFNRPCKLLGKVQQCVYNCLSNCKIRMERRYFTTLSEDIEATDSNLSQNDKRLLHQMLDEITTEENLVFNSEKFNIQEERSLSEEAIEMTSVKIVKHEKPTATGKGTSAKTNTINSKLTIIKETEAEAEGAADQPDQKLEEKYDDEVPDALDSATDSHTNVQPTESPQSGRMTIDGDIYSHLLLEEDLLYQPTIEEEPAHLEEAEQKTLVNIFSKLTPDITAEQVEAIYSAYKSDAPYFSKLKTIANTIDPETANLNWPRYVPWLHEISKIVTIKSYNTKPFIPKTPTKTLEAIIKLFNNNISEEIIIDPTAIYCFYGPPGVGKSSIIDLLDANGFDAHDFETSFVPGNSRLFDDVNLSRFNGMAEIEPPKIKNQRVINILLLPPKSVYIALVGVNRSREPTDMSIYFKMSEHQNRYDVVFTGNVLELANRLSNTKELYNLKFEGKLVPERTHYSYQRGKTKLTSDTIKIQNKKTILTRSSKTRRDITILKREIDNITKELNEITDREHSSHILKRAYNIDFDGKQIPWNKIRENPQILGAATNIRTYDVATLKHMQKFSGVDRQNATEYPTNSTSILPAIFICPERLQNFFDDNKYNNFEMIDSIAQAYPIAIIHKSGIWYRFDKSTTDAATIIFINYTGESFTRIIPVVPASYIDYLENIEGKVSIKTKHFIHFLHFAKCNLVSGPKELCFYKMINPNLIKLYSKPDPNNNNKLIPPSYCDGTLVAEYCFSAGITIVTPETVYIPRSITINDISTQNTVYVVDNHCYYGDWDITKTFLTTLNIKPMHMWFRHLNGDISIEKVEVCKEHGSESFKTTFMELQRNLKTTEDVEALNNAIINEYNRISYRTLEEKELESDQRAQQMLHLLTQARDLPNVTPSNKRPKRLNYLYELKMTINKRMNYTKNIYQSHILETILYNIEAEIILHHKFRLVCRSTRTKYLRALTGFHVYDTVNHRFVNSNPKIIYGHCYNGDDFIKITNIPRTNKYNIPKCNSRYVIMSDETEFIKSKEMVETIIPEIDKILSHDYDNIPIILHNGVPGCGKTHTILGSHNPKNDIVLTATKETREEYVEKGKGPPESYKTYDSVILNPITKKYEILWADEGLMVHAGDILIAIYKTNAKRCIIKGDRKQLPFISRLTHFPVTYGNLIIEEHNIEQFLTTYRLPKDITRILNKFYPGITTKSTVNGEIITEHIKSMTQLQGEYDIYLTFTQEEKFIVSLHVNTTVKTIHEFQGKTVLKTCIVRLSKQPNKIYSSEPHIIVAISRHKHSVTYKTFEPNDELWDLLNTKQHVEKYKLVEDLPKSYKPVYSPHVGLVERIVTEIHLGANVKESSLIDNILATLFQTTYKESDYTKITYTIPKVTDTNDEEETDPQEVQMELDYVFDRPDELIQQKLKNESVFPIEKEIKVLWYKLLSVSKSNEEYMTPLLITPQPPIYGGTIQEVMAAIRKRNLNPPILKYIRDPSLTDQIKDIFFKTFINPEKFKIAKTIFNLNDHSAFFEWIKSRTGTQISTLEGFDFVLPNKSIYNAHVKPLHKFKAGTINLEVSAGQTITAHHPLLNALFSGPFKIFAEMLRFCIYDKWLIKEKCTKQEMEGHFNKFIETAIKIIFQEVDMRKYDKSQEELALIVQCEILLAFGMKRIIVASWYECHTTGKLIFWSHGITVITKFQRKSGDVFTLIGNTLVLMFSIAFAYNLIEAILGIFVGDDIIVIFRSNFEYIDQSKLLAEVFNLSAKLENFPEAPYFASHFILHDSEYWRFIPDPVKAIVRLGRGNVYCEEHLEYIGISFSDNYNDYLNNKIRNLLGKKVKIRYKKDFLKECEFMRGINFIANLTRNPRKLRDLYTGNKRISSRKLPKTLKDGLLREIKFKNESLFALLLETI